MAVSNRIEESQRVSDETKKQKSQTWGSTCKFRSSTHSAAHLGNRTTEKEDTGTLVGLHLRTLENSREDWLYNYLSCI